MDMAKTDAPKQGEWRLTMANGRQVTPSAVPVGKPTVTWGVPKNGAENMVKQMRIQTPKESAKTRRQLNDALKKEFIFHLRNGIIKKAQQCDGTVKKGKQGKDSH